MKACRSCQYYVPPLPGGRAGCSNKIALNILSASLWGLDYPVPDSMTALWIRKRVCKGRYWKEGLTNIDPMHNHNTRGDSLAD